MKTVKRAIIGTVATLATLAALFFGGVGVAALVKGVAYSVMLQQVVGYLPFINA